MRTWFLCVMFCFIVHSVGLAQAASTQPTAVNSSVPNLMRFSGAAPGSPAGVVGATFALYAEQDGGSPLWVETQNVDVDASGHYSVLLGAGKKDGLPAELFASGQARWLGVKFGDATESTRVLLVSVPYALKAGDAETLGGLPASAFVQNAGAFQFSQIRFDCSAFVTKFGGTS